MTSMLRGKNSQLEASNAMVLAVKLDDVNQVIPNQYVVWGGRHRRLAQGRLTQQQITKLGWDSYLCEIVDPRLLTTDEIWDLGGADNQRADLQNSLPTTNLGSILSAHIYLDDKMANWKTIIGKKWLKSTEGVSFFEKLVEQFPNINPTNLPKLVMLCKAVSIWDSSL